jgi:hypothetical protein
VMSLRIQGCVIQSCRNASDFTFLYIDKYMCSIGLNFAN